MKRSITTLSLIILTCSMVLAQPGDPGGDPDVPITGIEILIAAGGALGLRALLQRKDKK